MQFGITPDQKKELELRHKTERDGRVRDRIKAVLLKSEGWTNTNIAIALRVHEETVRQHLSDWLTTAKLKPENGGSNSKLNDNQSSILERHLEIITYTKVIDICAYVVKTFGVHYTVSGMTKWLKQHNFSYKMPKTVPAKADLEKQEKFVEEYLNLITDTPENEPILFIDSVHPTMATKVACGWIKKGIDKPIAQSASRTRVNIMGAIELATMKTTTHSYDTINGESTIDFLTNLKQSYPNSPKIHVILDQSGYHTSLSVKDFALKESIELHFLPPYSPNLNPIERLWKVMNETVRNNKFFHSAKEFRGEIANFFDIILPKIASSLRGRINDNFQIIKAVPSS